MTRPARKKIETPESLARAAVARELQNGTWLYLGRGDPCDAIMDKIRPYLAAPPPPRKRRP